MSAKLLKGRYTTADGFSGDTVDAVRYLNPSNGLLYIDPNGTHGTNSGFRATGNGRWANGTWEFMTNEVIAESSKTILGYVVASERGAPTVLHRTQKIAEAEALRLAQGNTGFEFTVFPVYCGKAVAKAHTPKPVAKLEKL